MPAQRPLTGSEDHEATVPARGWDQAATLPASAPAPGSQPSSDATLSLNLNHPQLGEPRPTAPAFTGLGTNDAATVVDTRCAAAAAAARAFDATIPAGTATSSEALTLPQSSGITGSSTSKATVGSFSGTATSERLNSSFARSGTRLGRTRINGKLELTDQQLDERLQLSRTSVLTDMAAVRGTEAVPRGLAKLVEQQGTDARYHINRPLAAGGMGAVLDIQDNDFRRTAAMKVIHGKFADDPQALERFLAEAQVTAQLEHPNIVPIHDMGVMPDGSLYFTMKLIEGLSLGDLVKFRRLHAGLMTREQYLADKEKKEAGKALGMRKAAHQLAADYAADSAKGAELNARFTVEETLLTFLKVLDGVGFAHSRGVIHRDIKPDNIMLGAHGEVLVVDWGIAKVLKKADREHELVQRIEREVVSLRDENALSATMAGSAMGTLFYMPPEQARGDLDQIDGRSDIYALGATLYELLSLKRCIDVRSMQEALAAITTGDWIPLDNAAPELSRDLVAIVHRSMALSIERRYPTCADFADDIRRYLAGQAVLARRRNLVERLGAWYGAHKRQVQMGAAGAALVAVTAGGLIGLQASRNAETFAIKLTEADRLYRAAVPTDDLAGYAAAQAMLEQAALFNANDPRLGELKGEIVSARTLCEQRLEADKTVKAERELAQRQFNEAQALVQEAKYEDADRLLLLALKKDGGNADYLALRDQVQRTLSDKLQRAHEEDARQLRRVIDDQLDKAAKLERWDPQVPALLDAAKTALDQIDQRKLPAPVGTQERVAQLATLRRESEQARNARQAIIDALPLKQSARANLAAGDLAAARSSLEQARGKTPSDPELDVLLGELSVAESRAAEAARVLAANRNRDQALLMAEGARKAGKFDEALTSVALALTHVPGDSKALEVRTALVAEKAAADQEVRRLAAAAIAAGSLAQVAQSLQVIISETAKAQDAQAQVARLEKELGRAPVDQKGPLFAAIAEQKRARTVVAETWALAEGAANGALAALAEFPADPMHAEVRRTLCRLYLARLRDARGARSLPEIKAFTNLIQRFDPDGSFAKELANNGRLTVTGAPVVVRRLAEGPDTRLVADGPEYRNAEAGLELPEGSYEIRVGERFLAVVLAGGQDLAVTWPTKLPSIEGLPLGYVPPQAGKPGFMLGMTEVTVGQYCRYLNDPAVLARVSESFKRSQEAAAENPPRALPVAGLPGSFDGLGWVWALVKLTARGDKPDQLEKILPIEADKPVSLLARADAEAYCLWLSQKSGFKARLPRAAEWQFAAHGGDSQRIYPWGSVFVGQFTGSALSAGSNQQAFPVGSFREDRGPFGHLDLAGNLREWLGERDQDGPLAAGASGALIAGGGFSSDSAATFACQYSESVEPAITSAAIGFRVLVELR
jgi:serine/threonine protein kinase/formylglycine-generating enzyme required for sulfatase activity